MKRLLLICMVVFMAGCTTMTYHKASNPDGTIVVDIVVKRLPFVKADAVTPEVAMGADTSVEFAKALSKAIEAYGKFSMPASAVAVPKAEAQATPPPAQ